MTTQRLINLFISIFVLISLSGLQASSALEAHEHGHSIFNLIVENNSLYIEFESPAINLIGFEHNPETENQQAIIEQVREALLDFPALFKTSAQAGCNVLEKSAEWNLHAEESNHAEFHASYQLECDTSKLSSIELTIFDDFPGIEEIEAQILLPNKQLAFELNSQNRLIQLH